MEKIPAWLGLLLLWGCIQTVPTENVTAPAAVVDIDHPPLPIALPPPTGPIYEKALIIEYNRSMVGRIYAPKNLVSQLAAGDIQVLWRCTGDPSFFLSYYQRFGVGFTRQYNENGQSMRFVNVTYTSKYGFIHPDIPGYQCNPLGFGASPPIPLAE